MESRTNSVVMGCVEEPRGTDVAESDPRDIAMDALLTRLRLPYSVCLAMRNGDERSLREAVRQLVEGAV